MIFAAGHFDYIVTDFFNPLWLNNLLCGLRQHPWRMGPKNPGMCMCMCMYMCSTWSSCMSAGG